MTFSLCSDSRVDFAGQISEGRKVCGDIVFQMRAHLHLLAPGMRFDPKTTFELSEVLNATLKAGTQPTKTAC